MRTNTRAEAWESVHGIAPNLREAIYALIEREPMTDDEVEVVTGLRHQTASARVNELMRSRRVRDSGRRRKTRSGRRAIVWTAKMPHDGQMDLFDGG